MSDVMIPISFKHLLKWMAEEYQTEKTIFGIPEAKFYYKKDDSAFHLFGEKCETALGPAAGPHTQVAQNIAAAYLTGGRFFELKTVQIMDELEIEKPCIDAETWWLGRLGLGDSPTTAMVFTSRRSCLRPFVSGWVKSVFILQQ